MMNVVWLAILLSIGTAQFGSCDQTEYAPVVHLSGGKVRGVVQQSDDGHKVFEYQGIRYGNAVRFDKPQPAKPWNDVYNATKWRDACPQPDLGKPPNVPPFSTVTMSEDCLFVNVWTPNVDTANRTVMLWIYGGGFISGTIFTSFYDGRYISSLGDVVVVSVNYRLGAFGFLYGGTSDAPGNLAFHDQILALQWVKDNIRHFGGDPNKVTIFGESAGSASVGTLVISPLAKGLFHRAIMQSAAPNSHYGRITKASSLKLTSTLAHNVNCSLASMDDTVKCLRTKSVDQIMNGFVSDLVHDRMFKPIYGDELVPVKPEEALKTGKFNQDIDLMFGLVKDEGSSFVASLTPTLRTEQNFTVQSTQDNIKQMMHLYGESFGDEVAQYYTSKLQNPTQDQLKTAISNAWGHYHIACPTILFGEQFARLSPKHTFYSYQLMRPTLMIGCSGWMGVCHAEDLIYLFMLGQIKAQPELYQLGRDMIHAWTSFAKTGHPGKMGKVEWTEAFDRNTDRSISNFGTKQMSLDSSDYKMLNNLYKETCDTFWKPKIFV